LGGNDPVSASNTATEFVVNAYRNAYLSGQGVGVATARPSNVLAGGDHVGTRLIPSILNGFAEGKPVELRNPDQTRSWQSVLDALNGYLTIGRKLYENPELFSGSYNIGPTKEGICPVGYIYNSIQQYFENTEGYTHIGNNAVKESETLGLDIEYTTKTLGWHPEQELSKIIFELTDFFKRQLADEPERDICLRQIKEFFEV